MTLQDFGNLFTCIPLFFQKPPLDSRNALHFSTQARPQRDQYSRAILTCHKTTIPRRHFSQPLHVAYNPVNAATQSSRFLKIDSIGHYFHRRILGFSSRDVFLQTWHTFLWPVASRPLQFHLRNLPICRSQSKPRLTDGKQPLEVAFVFFSV